MATSAPRAADAVPPTAWLGELRVQVTEPRKETPASAADVPPGAPTAGKSSDTFVSYGVRAETTLPHFARTYMSTRKRFQDFAFLHDALVKDFPACVVPPLPEKHRISYLTGERFHAEFIERRRAELQLFLERLCRHPTLQRAKILQQFLESSEWHIDMHTHSGNPIAAADSGSDDTALALTAAPAPGLLESMSDTILNAFVRVRKPDPRFVAMRTALEEEEDRVTQLARNLQRNRNRVSVAVFDELYATPMNASNEDLSMDYSDAAAAFDKLAVLESGIAPTITQFAAALREFSKLETQFMFQSTDDVLAQLHAMIAYTHAHKGILKQRESKQLDFEGLTDYLASVVTERDRLAALGTSHDVGVTGNIRGTGVRGYLRSTVDRVWGVDEEQARIERMQRLDRRTSDLQDAVNTAHEHSQAFNAHVLQEHHAFEIGRRREMAHVLAHLADGNIATYARGVEIFDDLVQSLGGDGVGEAP
ncbi:intercellular trafficking and secretion [Malassezia sp. CBS 17886]|nr:intercellular trafficking and secretion [Malassezia sp. CBS 17886]